MTTFITTTREFIPLFRMSVLLRAAVLSLALLPNSLPNEMGITYFALLMPIRRHLAADPRPKH
jgi:hypothetical protein